MGHRAKGCKVPLLPVGSAAEYHPSPLLAQKRRFKGTGSKHPLAQAGKAQYLNAHQAAQGLSQTAFGLVGELFRHQ